MKAYPESPNYDAILSVALFQNPFYGMPKLGLRLHQHALQAIDFIPGDTPDKAPDCDLGRSIVSQLQSYFDGSNSTFSIPLALNGSAFQRRVWQALQAIPAGATLSYGQLARQLGTHARAIGGACRSNPIPIVIPCHRIVSAGYAAAAPLHPGRSSDTETTAPERYQRITAISGLGGYSGEVAGATLHIKHCLLHHERGNNTP